MTEHHLHIVEIPPCRVQHGEPRGVGLDGKARLDELERAHLVGEIARPPRSGRRRADEGAAAEPARHEPRLFELVECAPHGAPRRLKCRRQLPLGRKPVAFGISAGLTTMASASLLRCSVKALPPIPQASPLWPECRNWFA